MIDDNKKEPSAPYGKPDKNETKDKKNLSTGEPSAPYGVEEENESTGPARKEYLVDEMWSGLSAGPCTFLSRS